VRAHARRRPGKRLGAALGGRPGLIPGVGQHEERRRLEGGVAGGRTMLPERADDLEVAEIRAFEQGLYQFMDSSRSSLVQRITNEKVLTDEIRAELGAALKEYKEKYRAEKALAK